MDSSKIQLSTEEMQLLCNPEWILTKHRIIEKVYGMFGNISRQMQLYVEERAAFLPSALLASTPKISKGEQYEALPYVVLDYPRIFSKEDVLAVRCFFWWGNYFSITLQLKGRFYRQWHHKINTAITGKKLEGFYFSFSGNEFSFNLAAENYLYAGSENHQNYTAEEGRPFLKISYKISFEQWDAAEQKLLNVFQQFISLLEN